VLLAVGVNIPPSTHHFTQIQKDYISMPPSLKCRRFNEHIDGVSKS
jgi:hypothetical protein